MSCNLTVSASGQSLNLQPDDILERTGSLDLTVLVPKEMKVLISRPLLGIFKGHPVTLETIFSPGIFALGQNLAN